MAFDFRTFFHAFYLAFKELPNPKRFVGLTLLLLFYPGVTFFNHLMLALDHVFFPGFRKVDVKSPVFIVGNARSGTTFMHRLMCKDEERFTYFKAYELFFPSLIHKKMIRAVASFDDSVLGGRLSKRLHKFEDRVFARFRELHPISITGSEEDETMMVHCFSSPFICVLFPYLKDMEYLHFFDKRPAKERKRLMGFYKRMVQRQMYLDGGNRILCSKNPMFTTKMRSLLETFPDAKFVYMARNPYETLPSVQSMLYNMWSSAWCDVEKTGEAVSLLGSYSMDAYRYAFEVLDELDEDRYTMVKYEDLVSDPKGTVERIYERLEFKVEDDYAQVLQGEADKAKSYTSKHKYTLEEFGLSKEKVSSQLPEVFERFGWEV